MLLNICAQTTRAMKHTQTCAHTCTHARTHARTYIHTYTNTLSASQDFSSHSQSRTHVLTAFVGVEDAICLYAVSLSFPLPALPPPHQYLHLHLQPNSVPICGKDISLLRQHFFYHLWASAESLSNGCGLWIWVLTRERDKKTQSKCTEIE